MSLKVTHLSNCYLSVPLQGRCGWSWARRVAPSVCERAAVRVRWGLGYRGDRGCLALPAGSGPGESWDCGAGRRTPRPAACCLQSKEKNQSEYALHMCGVSVTAKHDLKSLQKTSKRHKQVAFWWFILKCCGQLFSNKLLTRLDTRTVLFLFSDGPNKTEEKYCNKKCPVTDQGGFPLLIY